MADAEARKPLWHADFLKVVLADFLVCASLYMFLPVAPSLVWEAAGGRGLWAAAAAFVAGMCLVGPFCNYGLDTYRRKSVALWGVAGMVAATALCFWDGGVWVFCAARLLQGGAYGVFQIAVGGTLLLDLSDSRKRTEAAHVYYWFTRLALVLGPLAGLVVVRGYGLRFFAFGSLALCLCAGVLLWTLRVPFRAPLEPSLWSSDRFWLSRGLRLFVPLVAVAFSAGLMLGRCGGAGFYLSLGVGFWLALCLHVLLFGPHLQRELAAGYALLLLAFLLYSWEEASGSGAGWAAGCLGCGLGLVSSRYLLSCIRICAHCERATAQNTYLLAWESGLLAGYSVAAVPLKNLDESSMATGAAVVAAAGIFHGLCVRRWYAAHKRK